MLIGLAVYLHGSRDLPPDVLSRTSRPRAQARLGRGERRAILALIVLCIPVTFFWATYEQQGNTVALWADAFTDRTIDLVFWTAEIPTTWFQSFNPFMIFAFTPLVVALWTWQARRGREPSTVAKLAFGCLGVAGANLIMAVAAWTAGGDGKASWLWLLMYFVVITLGELYLSPIGLSLVSKVAPPSRLSMMMGIWLATSFTGNFIGGWLGGFWDGMAKGDFFLMIGGIAALAAAGVWALGVPLKPALREQRG
jgi:POT family proton-dependent oligopeptide transporter